MKAKTIILFVFYFSLGLSEFYSQEQPISGVVTSAINELPIPGVNIIVKGTTRGTQTDFDGNYALQADRGAVIVFSYVGFKTKEVIVGDETTINIQLQEDAAELEEVVVTAQGISRQKKAIGYAVSTLKADAIESKPEADLNRILTGKISGVNVIGSGGLAGSGTNITIRGNVSITGNNQPLYVVNGVPFNTNTNAESNVSTGNGSSSASSRSLDIDPNSITDMSVLKGLSATTLYGDAGRNGVILITTKTGSTALVEKGFEITFNQSVFINEIAGLPDYQNTYGQGADNSPNVAFVGNWGGRFDDNYIVPHHYDQDRLAIAYPEYQGATVTYQPYKDNVKDFFRQGVGTTTSLNVSKSSENVAYNINFGHTNEDGYVPGNNVKRSNFGIGGSAKLSNKFTVTGSFNFAKSEFITPPVSANNGTGNFSIFTRTLFIPRNLDLNGLPYQNPIDGSSVYYRTDQENPLWLVNNAQEAIDVNRFYNSVSTTYDLSENVALTYRVGLDTYTEKQQFYINKGGVSSDLASQGFLKTTSGTNTIWDHTFLVSLKQIALSEKFNFNGVVGFNTNSESYEKFGVASTQQIVFDFIDHNNFSTQSNVDPLGGALDFIQKENTIGLYAQMEFDYSNSLFLTLAARNDWSSTIERKNSSLLYPSASIAFIPTSAFSGMKSDIVNFMKLRFGYGTSAGFPSPYQTRPVILLGTQQFGDLNVNTNASTQPNPDLKAELHKEFELGIETNLFKNIVSLEVSVYKRNSEDQILNKTLDASTGYTATTINAGSIESEGLEVDLSISPFKNKGEFQWTTGFIFTATQNDVIDLPGGDDVFIAGFSNLGNYAIEGEPLGVLKGSYALRDDEGNLLINPNTGDIIASDAVGLDDKIIGDPNPDWKMTNNNTFSYKGFSLTTQIEYTHGGDFSSNTIGNLLRRGVTKDTEDREGTFVTAGVLANPDTGEVLLDSSGNKIPNTIQQGANEVYFLNVVDPSDQGVYDGSIVRLREISLSYNFPSNFLDKTPFGSLSFTLLGQNMWYWAPNVPKYTNFDPEVISTGVGNGAGLDFQTAPSSKKYGFSLKATF